MGKSLIIDIEDPNAEVRKNKSAFVFAVALLAIVSFLCGVFLSQAIPKTIFTSPVLTWRMMRDYPLGSSVRPVKTPQAQEQFEQLGWWREAAIVVGYENITFDGKTIMLCLIRTQQGRGNILAVNPSWIDRGQYSADNQEN